MKKILIIVLCALSLNAFAQRKELSESKFLIQLEGAFDINTFNKKNLSFSEENVLLNFRVAPKLLAKIQMGSSKMLLHEEKYYEDLIKFGAGLGYIIPVENSSIPSHLELVVRGGYLAPMDDDIKTDGGYFDVLVKAHEGHAFVSLGITNTFMNGQYYIGPFLGFGITF
ncbi:MAG: hypothetical protein ACK5IJ_11120 [Mangrovibacterium sp.]